MSLHLLYVTTILGGFVVLAWSADWLVDNACILARHWCVPPFVIGVIILGFGTSLPELLVSAIAAVQGSGAMAIGNAFGSNIANIALILGVCALITPLFTDRILPRRDLPIILFSTAGVFWVLSDLSLGRLEGIALLLALVAIIGWIIHSGRASVSFIDTPKDHSAPVATLYTLLGLIALLASSWALIWGCLGLARAFGLNELLIGLTLVAVGTSLPELAASIAALKRSEGSSLILGNVIGSNLFNTLGVVGLPAVIRPFEVPSMLWQDGLIMLGLTAGLGLLLLYRQRLQLARAGAIILLLCYIVYLGWNAERMMVPA